MARSLIVLPDDSARPILDAINAAEKSIRVKMFVFSDPELLKAIIAAHHRGVAAFVDRQAGAVRGGAGGRHHHRQHRHYVQQRCCALSDKSGFPLGVRRVDDPDFHHHVPGRSGVFPARFGHGLHSADRSVSWRSQAGAAGLRAGDIPRRLRGRAGGFADCGDMERMKQGSMFYSHPS